MQSNEQQIKSFEPSLRFLAGYIQQGGLKMGSHRIESADLEKINKLRDEQVKLRKRPLKFGSAESAKANKLSWERDDLIARAFDKLCGAAGMALSNASVKGAPMEQHQPRLRELSQWLAGARPGLRFNWKEINHIFGIFAK
jgi:hypothetical protein